MKRGWDGRGPRPARTPRSVAGVRTAGQSIMRRGGVDFTLDPSAGLVTCTVCRLYASSGAADLAAFFATHAERHAPGTPAAAALVADAGQVEPFAVAALIEKPHAGQRLGVGPDRHGRNLK